MTDKLRAAVQEALHVLETEALASDAADGAEEILRAALADVSVDGKSIESAEPVAWTRKQMGCDREYCETPFTTDWTPLYTAPPSREWVSLTDEEIKSMWEFPQDLSWMDSVLRLVRKVEETLKARNQGDGNDL